MYLNSTSKATKQCFLVLLNFENILFSNKLFSCTILHNKKSFFILLSKIFYWDIFSCIDYPLKGDSHTAKNIAIKYFV